MKPNMTKEQFKAARKYWSKKEQIKMPVTAVRKMCWQKSAALTISTVNKGKDVFYGIQLLGLAECDSSGNNGRIQGNTYTHRFIRCTDAHLVRRYLCAQTAGWLDGR